MPKEEISSKPEFFPFLTQNQRHRIIDKLLLIYAKTDEKTSIIEQLEFLKERFDSELVKLYLEKTLL